MQGSTSSKSHRVAHNSDRKRGADSRSHNHVDSHPHERHLHEHSHSHTNGRRSPRKRRGSPKRKRTPSPRKRRSPSPKRHRSSDGHSSSRNKENRDTNRSSDRDRRSDKRSSNRSSNSKKERTNQHSSKSSNSSGSDEDRRQKSSKEVKRNETASRITASVNDAIMKEMITVDDNENEVSPHEVSPQNEPNGYDESESEIDIINEASPVDIQTEFQKSVSGSSSRDCSSDEATKNEEEKPQPTPPPSPPPKEKTKAQDPRRQPQKVTPVKKPQTKEACKMFSYLDKATGLNRTLGPLDNTNNSKRGKKYDEKTVAHYIVRYLSNYHEIGRIKTKVSRIYVSLKFLISRKII